MSWAVCAASTRATTRARAELRCIIWHLTTFRLYALLSIIMLTIQSSKERCIEG